MKELSQSPKLSFLLDENVSYGVKKFLESKGHEANTVQVLDKRRIRNSALLELVRSRGEILITCDKDFLEISLEEGDSIILIDIHPLIDENVIPAFKKLLDKISISDLKENFIILYEKSFKIRAKR